MYNNVVSQSLFGVPTLLRQDVIVTPPTPTTLDLSGFINAAGDQLMAVEAAFDAIETKDKQSVADEIVKMDWFDLVHNDNLFGDNGLPVNRGAIRRMRSVTSATELNSLGSLTAYKFADRTRFGRDNYRGPFQESPTMTLALVANRMRASRVEYLVISGAVRFAISLSRPKHRIAFLSSSGWKLSTQVSNNNKQIYIWQVDNSVVRFWINGVLINEETITPIAPALIAGANWFGLSRAGQMNLDGYGLFVGAEPIDITKLLCFADSFYSLGLGFV